MKSFLEFVHNKKGGDEPLSSKVSLGDGNDFPPLVISDDPNSEHYGKNKNLAPIVRAFKKGANWGWSKDDKTGEDKPIKVGGKKLFLTGGALRDHLTGKKPRNHELVTNSSPDEVFNILKQNGFDFVGDSDPGESDKKKIFWVESKDKKGRPYTFGIRVKNDTFELSVFKKTAKDKDLEPGTQSDDASGRDFTLNSMYLLLSNDNGPNKDLSDFYGGVHHLKNGKVVPVGDLGKKIKEDPIRALRYARMLSRYGDPKKVSQEEKDAIKAALADSGQMDPKAALDEFMKGLNYDDVDSRNYLSTYNNLGLLGSIFPGIDLDTKLPKELRELGDKHAPIAWMLRKHDPKKIEGLLGSNWKPEDLKKILFLIKSLNLSPETDENSLDDIVKSYLSSGVSSRKLKQWLSKLGGKPEPEIDAFLQHASGPRIKPHTMLPDGEEELSFEFIDLRDPFTGQLNFEAVQNRVKRLELENYRKLLNQNRVLKD